MKAPVDVLVSKEEKAHPSLTKASDSNALINCHFLQHKALYHT